MDGLLSTAWKLISSAEAHDKMSNDWRQRAINWVRDVPEFIATQTPDPFAAPGWPDDRMLEAAMGLISNAGEGNWEMEHPTWRDAAARWIDAYGVKVANARSAERVHDDQIMSKIETWLKAVRDEQVKDSREWYVLDQMLDEARDAFATGQFPRQDDEDEAFIIEYQPVTSVDMREDPIVLTANDVPLRHIKPAV